MSDREGLPVTNIEALEYTQSDEGCLFYDASYTQVHFLNLTACFVLLSCDGKTGRKVIAESLKHAFGLAATPLAEVDACLSTLRESGLLG